MFLMVIVFGRTRPARPALPPPDINYNNHYRINYSKLSLVLVPTYINNYFNECECSPAGERVTLVAAPCTPGG